MKTWQPEKKLSVHLYHYTSSHCTLPPAGLRMPESNVAFAVGLSVCWARRQLVMSSFMPPGQGTRTFGHATHDAVPSAVVSSDIETGRDIMARHNSSWCFLKAAAYCALSSATIMPRTMPKENMSLYRKIPHAQEINVPPLIANTNLNNSLKTYL